MENLKSDLKYEILFGGGAIRGVAYCGAIKALEEMGVTFDSVAGSSVGSVLAGFVAVGYNAEEITNHPQRAASGTAVDPETDRIWSGTPGGS